LIAVFDEHPILPGNRAADDPEIADARPGVSLPSQNGDDLDERADDHWSDHSKPQTTGIVYGLQARSFGTSGLSSSRADLSRANWFGVAFCGGMMVATGSTNVS
jgi:hypothetical protein